MTDVVWQAMIAAGVTIILTWMQMRTKLAVEQASQQATKKANQVATKMEEAAVRVEEVKDTLNGRTEKFDELKDVALATHTLVNSNYEIQLQLTATYARELVELTRKLGLNIERAEAAAETAERLLAEHQAKQRMVDKRKPS